MKPLYEYILANIGIFGIFLICIAWILKSYIKPKIESEIKLALEISLEKEKANNSLAQKRIDIASELLDIMAELCNRVQEDICEAVEEVISREEFKSLENPSEKFLFIRNNILSNKEYHPKWRKEYVSISHKFERTNEAFSSYTLQLEELIHPNVLKEIFDKEFVSSKYRSKKFKSDFIYVYNKIWQQINTSLNSLFRINTMNIEFWTYRGESGYGKISDKYAESDLGHIKNYCLLISSGKGFCVEPEVENILDNGIFYISLEKKEELSAFWKEIQAVDEAA